ncbi:hypothetical protein ACFLTG_02765 [Chloroflexota bacterium]
MKLARSSFYYRPKDKSPEWMEAEADLRNQIEAIFEEECQRRGIKLFVLLSRSHKQRC